MIDELLADAEAKMDLAVAHAGGEFATVRTGRANPALLHRIMVDYYGTPTPLNQIANLDASLRVLLGTDQIPQLVSVCRGSFRV